MKYFVKVNGAEHEVEVVERLGDLEVRLAGRPVEFHYHEVNSHGQISLTVGERSYGISVEGDCSDVVVTLAGQRYAIDIEDERERAAGLAARARGGAGGPVKSVMPGVVVELLVAEGDEVEEGQPLLILEAMKMQNEIEAPTTGRVAQIHVATGQAVGAGEKLVTIEVPPAE
ncbi:Glutaconyl-CoA decarboxylase subunit gamma [Planctomycetes bacterium Pla163]|uniref:Glutaconyl-CoA decarboxylase subunit gamma n=1 Tax=Rohdeia mirabilis TaxID=2528008 RepID=A0A518D348_9BACT|nr:Glutaconyl-CoA decarboxylase subunit gamma [Planctomycetes bacterium Pla163]